MRANAASAEGENAVSARACSAVGGQVGLVTAPQTETAVRSASIGWASTRQRAEGRHHGVRHGQARELGVRHPLARPEQLRDRRVGPALDQLADGVPAVEEAAGLAVDVRERGLAGDDALEAWGDRVGCRQAPRQAQSWTDGSPLSHRVRGRATRPDGPMACCRRLPTRARSPGPGPCACRRSSRRQLRRRRVVQDPGRRPAAGRPRTGSSRASSPAHRAPEDRRLAVHPP